MTNPTFENNYHSNKSDLIHKLFELNDIPYNCRYTIKNDVIILNIKDTECASNIDTDYIVRGNTFSKLYCEPGVELPRIENFEPFTLKHNGMKTRFETIKEYNTYRIVQNQLQQLDRKFKKNINNVQQSLNIGFCTILGMQVCIFACVFLILCWV